MKFTAQQIAGILEGEVIGNPDVEVSKLAKIEEGVEGTITFLSNPKYKHYIYSTNASIAIVNKTFHPESSIKTTLIKVDDAYKAFSKLLEYYNSVKNFKQGIEQPSYVADSSKLGNNLYLGAFSYIGNNVVIGDDVRIFPNSYIGDNVTIGNNTVIFSGTKIYADTIVGSHCILNSGVIIGADGFGFVPNEDGGYSKIPQIGNVVIEDYVDIGASTTIDRATLGSTIIRKGVKLDNQIHIAHNVEIGSNTVIAAQTGIAGSAKIGENCQIGGQVGIAGHITIGNNVKIQAQSGIGKSIKDDAVIQGSPAFSLTDYSKSYVHFKNLPKIVKHIDDLEKKIHGNN